MPGRYGGVLGHARAPLDAGFVFTIKTFVVNIWSWNDVIRYKRPVDNPYQLSENPYCPLPHSVTYTLYWPCAEIMSMIAMHLPENNNCLWQLESQKE